MSGKAGIRRMHLAAGAEQSCCAHCPATGCEGGAAMGRSADRLEAGAVIYRTGAPGRDLFMVRRGFVKLLRYTRAGEERIVRLLPAGSLFGFEALFGRCYQHQAAAVTACDICRVPGSAVLNGKAICPDALQVLLGQYERSMDVADTLLAELNTGSARRRVARLFHFLADGKDGREIPLLSREEMAGLLGVTMHTASRVVAEFRRTGLLQAVGRQTCRYRQAAVPP